MRARHGHTLIECTVALTLIGAAFSSVALMMHATRQANRRVRDAVACEVDLGRLAAQLRSDAHRATSARVEGSKKPDLPATVMSLALPDDGKVEYTLLAHGVDRVLRRGPAVLHRETYGLSASSAGRWLLREGGRSPVISLVLEPVRTGSGGEVAEGAGRVDAGVHLFRSNTRTSKP